MNKSLVTNVIAIILIILGYVSPYYASELKAMGLYAFSGAITNWLAIHMLFEKVPFLYGSGIVTERFQEFKLGIKNLVMNQFFTQENFEKFLSGSKDSLLKIEEESIFEAVDFDKIFNKLKMAIMQSPFGGMLGMFGGEAALEPLKPQFEIKFKEVIHDLINDEKFLKSFTSSSESNDGLLQNVHHIIESRLNELTPQMVKEIIQEMIKEHLGWLVVWGGVFGALIGLVTTFIN